MAPHACEDMAAATSRPDRVCGLHYFNPVQVMKLVEVVSTKSTDPAVEASMFEFVKNTKKVRNAFSSASKHLFLRYFASICLRFLCGVAILLDSSSTDCSCLT